MWIVAYDNNVIPMRLKIIDIWARHTSAANTSWIWLNKIPTQHSIGICNNNNNNNNSAYISEAKRHLYYCPFFAYHKIYLRKQIGPHLLHPSTPHAFIRIQTLYGFFFALSPSLGASTPCTKGIKCMWIRECVVGVGWFNKHTKQIPSHLYCTKIYRHDDKLCSVAYISFWHISRVRACGGAQILLFCTSCTQRKYIL